MRVVSTSPSSVSAPTGSEKTCPSRKDLPLAYFYERARSFRITDGADEVHRRSIARDTFEDLDDAEIEHVLTFDEELLDPDLASDSTFGDD